MDICTIPSSWLCRTQDRCEDAGMVWSDDQCHPVLPDPADFQTELEALNGLSVQLDYYGTHLLASVRSVEYVLIFGFILAFGLILFVPVWKFLFKLIKTV